MGGSNTVCDTATLLPADLISPQGGGGAGINENLSKVLKWVIAQGKTLIFLLLAFLFLAM